MNNNIQDAYLEKLQKDANLVHMYLVNGIKLHGKIESFDENTILLKDTSTQMVYKHAISTIIPV